MRLMLGCNGIPSLLVSVSKYTPTEFNFDVINGAWEGKFTNGYITVFDAPSGEFSSLAKHEILCDNQDRLRGEYNDVFANFDNENYVAPKYEYTPTNFDDDDIPF